MQIVHDEQNQKFHVIINGKESYLYYRQRENIMDIASTYVPNELRGRGIAAELTQFALNYARENKLLIIPSCSFVDVYIRRHQEYADLLA